MTVMLWVKVMHLSAMVAWFSGLFYLPRLFVYHASAMDKLSLQRFKVMEKRLYYIIMTPAGFLTMLFGFWLFSFNANVYWHATWMQFKLLGVSLLWVYHIYCGYLLKQFKCNKNRHTALFYRYFNEVPTLFLFLIMSLVVVKPHF